MARILVLDDEEYVRNLVCEIVQRMGHTAIEAEDGKAALKKYTEGGIDLAIADINMPEMDGITFLEEAKKVDPHAVVIMMTGYPSAETIIQTIEDDGYTYVAKPLKIDRLRDLIQRGLEARKMRLQGKQGDQA